VYGIAYQWGRRWNLNERRNDPWKTKITATVKSMN